jgi:hypothetical protein
MVDLRSKQQDSLVLPREVATGLRANKTGATECIPAIS